MPRLGFGAFLAPHHPIGENPTLQFRRDLKFVEHLDELGYDEFWCGEHHSSGWETIASPEIFIATAAERTPRRVLPAPAQRAPDPIEDDVLVVMSKLKNYVRARSGYNTSDRVAGPLSEALRVLCDRAIDKARAEGRKTVLDRDFD